MLIGILSDTHAHGEAASAAGTLFRSRGAEFLIHCGDVGSTTVLDQLAFDNAAFVWGNTDHDRPRLARYAESIGVQCLDAFGELTLGGKRFAITHGDDARLVRQIIEQQQHDYLLVGHTHVRSDRRVRRVRIINPGALYRAAEKTVALLETETDRLEFLVVAV